MEHSHATGRARVKDARDTPNAPRGSRAWPSSSTTPRTPDVDRADIRARVDVGPGRATALARRERKEWVPITRPQT